MSSEKVAFEITANTKPAGKALLDLSRLLNKVISVPTKGQDQAVIKQQKEYKKLATTVNDAFKEVKRLNAEDKKNGGKAQLPFNQYAANEKKIENLSKQLEGTTDLKERRQLTAEINGYKKANKTMDDYAAQVLKQILGTETKIVSDEQSILGIKTEQVSASKKVADDTKKAADSEAELNKKVKENSADLEKQAGAAKKSGDALNKTTKEAATKTAKRMEEAKTKLSSLGSVIDKILAKNFSGPDKFTFADFASAKQDLIELKDLIEFLRIPPEMKDDYNRIVIALNNIALGERMLKKEQNEVNKKPLISADKVEDEAAKIEQRIYSLKETATKAMSMPMTTGELDRGDLDQRIKQLETIQKEIKGLGIPQELKAQYTQIGDELVKLRQKKTELDKAIRTPIKPEVEVAEVKTLDETLKEVASTTTQVDKAMQTDPASNNIAELLRRISALQEAKKTIESLNLPAGADATYNRIVQLLATLTGQVSEYKRELNGTSREHEKTKKSGTNFTKFVTAGVKSLKSAMSNLAKTSSKVKSSFDNMARSMRSNFKHMITNITKYVLGFRSLFFLVRRLRKYLGEGIQNLVQFNNGNNIVNESITDLLSSLLFLKNAWAAAFSPIITFVRPMLVKLIDSIAEVGNAVARFLSALFGQEIAFNAVRVRAKDYADSLDNAGGSASGAADKVKKLTDRLAAFDDLNVLGVDNDPDGTGRGGGGGLADEYVPDPNEMFTIVDPERNGFLEMLKKAWEDADFSVVGTTIKDKIITQLQGIDWDSVQGTGIKIGSSLGSFIAGLFGDPELFKVAGTTIGETLNTITYTIQAFLDWTDGIDFGGNLAEGFNTFLDVTDWQTAGDNINGIITGIVDNVDSFITTLDADKVVTAIKDFMTGLNIKEIVASVTKLALDVTDLVITITKGLILEAGQSFGDSLIKWVKEDMPSAYTDENGIKVPMSIDMTPTFDYDEHPLAALLERIQTGLGKAILNKVLNVEDLSPDELADLTDSWNNIINKLFKAVVDTFTLGTGTGGIITSLLNPPKDEEGNTDWEQIGYDIADGILIGMGKSLKKIGDNQWIRENIYDPFWEAVSNIFDMHSPSKVTEEWGGWIGEGLLNGISNLIPDVEQIFTDLKDWLSGKWDEIKGNTYEKWVGIKTNVLTKADEIKDSAEEKFDTLKTTLTNKWQEIKGAIYEKLVGIKLNVVTVFEQLKDAVKDPINGFLDIIEGMVNKCIDGINSLVDTLNVLPDVQFTNPITGTAYSLGFALPTLDYISIPHLAQGAVIPPNKEFMAVLGDQSNGTNIEAPLDTIKQAVAEVLANNGNAEMIQLLQQLITVVESKNLVIGDKDIGKANARYVKQQNIVRGSTF